MRLQGADLLMTILPSKNRSMGISQKTQTVQTTQLIEVELISGLKLGVIISQPTIPKVLITICLKIRHQKSFQN